MKKLLISLMFIAASFAANSQLEDIELNGWTFWGGRNSAYTIRIDNQISQHGQKSVCIERVVQNNTDVCTLLQRCIIKNFQGKRVKMTGYIKLEGLLDNAFMMARVDNFDKKISADLDDMLDRRISGTRDWTKCEIIFDVPDERYELTYAFIFGGNGKIWVDDVSFEIVSNSSNKTAYPMNQPINEAELSRIEADLPEKPPVNLDFEQ